MNIDRQADVNQYYNVYENQINETEIENQQDDENEIYEDELDAQDDENEIHEDGTDDQDVNVNHMAIANLPNQRNQPALANAINQLADPNLSDQAKFAIVRKVIGVQEKKKKKLKKDLYSLNNRYIQDTQKYKKDLKDQKKINKNLEEQLDEIKVKRLRESYIKTNNIEAKVTGGFLGSLGSVFAGGAFSILTGVPVPVDTVIIGGAVAGAKFFTKLDDNSRKESLEKYEKEFFSFKPNGTKMEAYEYAREKIRRHEPKEESDSDPGCPSYGDDY